MAKRSLSGIVLKETFVKVQRKWVSRFIFANLIYIIAIIGLLVTITEDKNTISSFFHGKQMIEEYRTKEKLYGILRTKGYSLGQGIDIV